MLIPSLALFLGILILHSVSYLPPSHLLGDALPLLLLLGFYLPHKRFIIILLLGFFWANWQAEQTLNLTLAPEFWQQKLSIEAKIIKIYHQDTDKTFLQVDVQTIQQPSSLANTYIGHVELGWYHRNQISPKITVGETWAMQVKLKPISSFRNQHSRDTSRYFFQQKIRHKGSVKQKPIRLKPVELNKLQQIRQQILTSIEHSLAEHPQRGLVEALAIGIRDNMSKTDWRVLQQTGTSHLISISGLHIGYVAFLTWFIVAGLYRSLAPIHWLENVSVPIVALTAAVIGASFYAALSGFAVPAQRALLMLSIPVIAKLFYKNIPLKKALAPTFILVLLWDSQVVFSASFYLSFFAVALMFWRIGSYPYQAIAVTIKRIKHRWKINADVSIKRPKYLKKYLKIRQKYADTILYIILYFKVLLMVSLTIMLGMLPLTLFWFEGQAWIAPIANVIAIPWIAFITLPIILMALLLHTILPAISHLLWQLSAYTLGLLKDYLDYLYHFNLFWEQGLASYIELIIAACILLLFLIPASLLPRRLLLLCFLLLFYRQPSQPNTLTVSVFDVGQGLALLISTENHHLLYDTGKKYASQQVILPHLKAKQIQVLDVLLISHTDADHSAGTTIISQQVAVKQLLSSKITHFNDLDIPKKTCQAGQKWQWDGVQFQILHPLSRYQLSSKNDNSCVLKVSIGEKSILITGDISQKAEGFLLQMQQQHLDSSVLIVPHHGSRYSSQKRFINNVKPELAIISTGFLNNYKHPVASVVQAYQASGATVLDTAVTGEIQLQFSATDLTWQIQPRRYWQHRYPIKPPLLDSQPLSR